MTVKIILQKILQTTVQIIVAAFLMSVLPIFAFADGLDEIARVEFSKYRENAKAYDEASLQTREQNQKESNSQAAIALVKMRAGMFKEAAAGLATSVRLEPYNFSLYSHYGFCLTKAGEVEKGIVYLTWSKTRAPQERLFNLGTAYLQLKKYQSADHYLTQAQSGKEKKYTALSAYYAGISKYEQGNDEAAKESFQTVIDQSSDPKLDAQAESQIEKILRRQRGEAEPAAGKAKKYALSALLAAQYDSNVLLAPDNSTDQGTALDEGGVRALLTGGFKAALVQSENSDWSAKVNAVYLRSDDENFRRADPYVIGLDLPYSRQVNYFGKTHLLQLSPGLQSIYMDLNQDNEREKILSALVLDVSNTTPLSPSRISVVGLQVRSDESKVVVQTPAQDASAKKIQLSTQQVYILDKAKAENLSGRLAVARNNSEGEDSRYLRFDLGATYARSLNWRGFSWSGTLSVYSVDYFDRADGRKDTNFALSTGLLKPLSAGLQFIFNLGFNQNQSNVDVNEYDKWTALTGLSLSHAF